MPHYVVSHLDQSYTFCRSPICGTLSINVSESGKIKAESLQSLYNIMFEVHRNGLCYKSGFFSPHFGNMTGSPELGIFLCCYMQNCGPILL